MVTEARSSLAPAQVVRMKLPVTPPIEPMLARLVDDLPDGWVVRAQWDGFRSLVFRDGAEVVIESRNNRPISRYLPEVVAAIKATLPWASARVQTKRSISSVAAKALLGLPRRRRAKSRSRRMPASSSRKSAACALWGVTP